MKNIAVQKGLKNISDYLSSHGYKVKEIDTRQKNSKDFIDGFDVVITTGMDDNITGRQTTMAKTTIINASGMSPQEVKNELERRMQ